MAEKSLLLRPGQVIAVEGLIGAGKTTACHCLAEQLRKHGFQVELFEEEVNLDLLQLFLADMKKYAFAFQLYMLESRINALRIAHRFAQQGGIAILDRSMVGDRAFGTLHYQQGNISQPEWEVYCSLFRDNIEALPNKIIYLSCDSKVSLERIYKRDRAGEKKDYNLEYLDNLQASYEKSLAMIEMVPVIRVNWNGDRDKEGISEAILKVCDL